MRGEHKKLRSRIDLKAKYIKNRLNKPINSVWFFISIYEI